MEIVKDRLWTRLLPEKGTQVDEKAWREHGGKWIIFDSKDKIEALAQKLENPIESGEIQSAKFWNKDPGAICVYSLDSKKEDVEEKLKTFGASKSRVWEYDFAWDKNVQKPLDFFYSQSTKFRTILKSYGCVGTLRLIKELLTPGEHVEKLKGEI